MAVDHRDDPRLCGTPAQGDSSYSGHSLVVSLQDLALHQRSHLHLDFMPKCKMKWCKLCGIMYTRPVGQHQLWQLFIPSVLWDLIHMDHEQHPEGKVESFHKAIRLGVIGCCPGFVDTQELADPSKVFHWSEWMASGAPYRQIHLQTVG